MHDTTFMNVIALDSKISNQEASANKWCKILSQNKLLFIIIIYLFEKCAWVNFIQK